MKKLQALGLIALVGMLAAALPDPFPYTGSAFTRLSNALYNIQTLTSSGTYNDLYGNRIHIKMCGGGGGAGGSKSSASGGGAGGAYVELWLDATLSTLPVFSNAVTIGAAGTAGVSTPGNGGNGGDTSITIAGTTYTAKGGLGSVLASSAASLGAAGQSGSTTGDVNKQGDPGTFGMVVGGTTYISGNGGSSPFGSGGVGVKVLSGATAGIAATGFCSGGGGGADFAGSGIAGGAGTAGIIVVEEWD